MRQQTGELNCPHRGRRVRDDEGRIRQAPCEACEGKLLDVFRCDHPATKDEVTLADCATCLYRPGNKSFVERVYLINLRQRKDRLAAFTARQESHGWPLPHVQNFAGLEGELLGVPSYFREGAGAWGCLRSHVSILETCLMEGVESVLVLEDDVEWFSGAWERLEAFLRDVPADWSQLMLGGQHIQDALPVAPGVVRCRNTQRTHAYALRGSAIKSLLKAWYSAAVHLDWIMGGDWQRAWPVYAPDPFIFGQAGGKSDISGRLNNSLYWNPPTNATVVHLVAEPDVAAALRCRGLHMGFRRNAQGYDEGLAKIVDQGVETEKLRSWLATILWETASIEGRVTTVWHPGVNREQLERIHAGDIRSIEATSVVQVLEILEDLCLRPCWSTSHVLHLEAPRAVVQALPGFHAGYWLDPGTGQDLGLMHAAAGDHVAGLKKWMKHTAEEAERSQLVPLVWCEGLTAHDVRAAFPDRTVVALRGLSVKAIQSDWDHEISKG